MRILLIGASGQVGSECDALLHSLTADYLALSRQQLDFADTQALRRQLVSFNPEVVVNACAYTAVDQAQTQQALAEQVNAQSVAILAQTCHEIGAILIHLSTDYVFDGQAQVPYTEDAQAKPLGVYGATKYAGEQAIVASMKQFVILRTSWVFGLQGHNFVKTMLRLGRERDQLAVVNDQWGRPTYAADIARVIVSIIERYQRKNGQLEWGVYHCCNGGETSWYAFAQSIMEQGLRYGLLSRLPEIAPIPSVDYPTPAPRPASPGRRRCRTAPSPLARGNA